MDFSALPSILDTGNDRREDHSYAERNVIKSGTDVDFGYVSETEIEHYFSWLVPQAMAHHNMKAVIETAKERRLMKNSPAWITVSIRKR